MDDLIERQAAIEALKDAINDSVVLTIQGSVYSYDDNYFGLEVALSIIQNLPSAQPDTTCKRPEGVWEPLGHRMGFLKHPDSEDYKCSICGYESYTLYSFPPKTCPECGADMRKSVKKLYDDMMSVPLPGWDEP